MHCFEIHGGTQETLLKNVELEHYLYLFFK